MLSLKQEQLSHENQIVPSIIRTSSGQLRARIEHLGKDCLANIYLLALPQIFLSFNICWYPEDLLGDIEPLLFSSQHNHIALISFLCPLALLLHLICTLEWVARLIWDLSLNIKHYAIGKPHPSHAQSEIYRACLGL